MNKVSIRLLVGDFPATLTFWRDRIHVALSYSDEAAGYAYGEVGGVGVEFFARDAFAAAIGQTTPAAAPVGQRVTIEVGVDDVDATYADAVAHGATSVATPLDRPEWGARTAHITDPDGNLIELYTKLPEDSAPTA
jgi:predicted enzyme related to lactoylglutathione lyase